MYYPETDELSGGEDCLVDEQILELYTSLEKVNKNIQDMCSYMDEFDEHLRRIDESINVLNTDMKLCKRMSDDQLERDISRLELILQVDENMQTNETSLIPILIIVFLSMLVPLFYHIITHIITINESKVLLI